MAGITLRTVPESTEINISMNMCMIQIAVFFIIRCQMCHLHRFQKKEKLQLKYGIYADYGMHKDVLPGVRSESDTGG